MPDSIGSLIRRAAGAACLALSIALPVHAQQPLGAAPSSVEFMSRFDFHLSAAGLSEPDRRLSWDTHWGGDFDFVDYVHGRLNFLVDYQLVLGDEYRLFDPNQGNYTLAVSSSVRIKGAELAGVLHHVSRHLSDRPNRDAVAWNALELRLMHQLGLGNQTLDVRLEGGPVVARAFVDYRWMAVFDSALRRRVTPHTQLYGRAAANRYGVDRDSDRRDQSGARVEIGVRLLGKSGALDLFGGYERVVDVFPLDRYSREWAFAGFRLVN